MSVEFSNLSTLESDKSWSERTVEDVKGCRIWHFLASERLFVASNIYTLCQSIYNLVQNPASNGSYIVVWVYIMGFTAIGAVLFNFIIYFCVRCCCGEKRKLGIQIAGFFVNGSNVMFFFPLMLCDQYNNHVPGNETRDIYVCTPGWLASNYASWIYHMVMCLWAIYCFFRYICGSTKE